MSDAAFGALAGCLSLCVLSLVFFLFGYAQEELDRNVWVYAQIYANGVDNGTQYVEVSLGSLVIINCVCYVFYTLALIVQLQSDELIQYPCIHRFTYFLRVPGCFKGLTYLAQGFSISFWISWFIMIPKGFHFPGPTPLSQFMLLFHALIFLISMAWFFFASFRSCQRWCQFLLSQTGSQLVRPGAELTEI